MDKLGCIGVILALCVCLGMATGKQKLTALNI